MNCEENCKRNKTNLVYQMGKNGIISSGRCRVSAPSFRRSLAVVNEGLDLLIGNLYADTNC